MVWWGPMPPQGGVATSEVPVRRDERRRAVVRRYREDGKGVAGGVLGGGLGPLRLKQVESRCYLVILQHL